MRLPVLPLAVVTGVVLMALAADVIAPHAPNQPSLSDRLAPPVWSPGGTMTFLLGTDGQGRDVLSRIIHGSRVSLAVGLGVVGLAGMVGLVVGLLSGYLGGKVDAFLMRLVDMMLAIPILLIAIVFAVSLGPSLANVVLALSIVLWSRFARVVRGEAIALKERGYVQAAEALGATPVRVMRRHVLPNMLNTFLIVLSVQLGWVILSEASLSFLGAGVPAPSVSWGAMVSEGRNQLGRAPWVSFFPGLAIVLLVMSVNAIGDWLRDWLDPRLRNASPIG